MASPCAAQALTRRSHQHVAELETADAAHALRVPACVQGELLAFLKGIREVGADAPWQAIASGLTDLDLVFIEEAFERLLLDYDRAPLKLPALKVSTSLTSHSTGVFSSMGIPSCLWRRTGEIYKGNKEFAALGRLPLQVLPAPGLTFVINQSASRSSTSKAASWRSTSSWQRRARSTTGRCVRPPLRAPLRLGADLPRSRNMATLRSTRAKRPS